MLFQRGVYKVVCCCSSNHSMSNSNQICLQLSWDYSQTGGESHLATAKKSEDHCQDIGQYLGQLIRKDWGWVVQLPTQTPGQQKM